MAQFDEKVFDKRIVKNRPILVEKINFDVLKNHLISKKVLDDRQQKMIDRKYKISDQEGNELLLDVLNKKSPKEKKNFYQLLKKHQSHLAKYLQPEGKKVGKKSQSKSDKPGHGTSKRRNISVTSKKVKNGQKKNIGSSKKKTVSVTPKKLKNDAKGQEKSTGTSKNAKVKKNSVSSSQNKKGSKKTIGSSQSQKKLTGATGQKTSTGASKNKRKQSGEQTPAPKRMKFDGQTTTNQLADFSFPYNYAMGRDTVLTWTSTPKLSPAVLSALISQKFGN